VTFAFANRSLAVRVVRFRRIPVPVLARAFRSPGFVPNSLFIGPMHRCNGA